MSVCGNCLLWLRAVSFGKAYPENKEMPLLCGSVKFG